MSTDPTRGPAGPEGPEGPAGPPGPHGESAYFEQATIDVSSARIIESDSARLQAHYLAYALVVLFVTGIGIGAANLLFTNSQVHHVAATNKKLAEAVALEQQQIRADCSWYADVSALPVSDPPGPAKPAIIVPRLISDSRRAWTGHGCPGKIPPPDPTFVHWAGIYKLPVYPH